MAKPPSKQKNPSRNIRKPARNLPAIVSPDSGAGPETMAPNPNAEEPKTKRNWVQDPAMFLVGVATVIVVGVYTLYARQQVIETQAANHIARQALTEANKPYVSFITFYITRMRASESAPFKWRIGPTWTNFGNSPASHVKNFLCDPIVRDNAAIPNFECHISESEQPETAIGPKQSVNIIGVTIDDDVISATVNGKKFLYIFGNITYSDSINITGEAKPRLTWFCQRVIKATPVPGAQPLPPDMLPQLGFLGCPTLNCADNACKPPHAK